MNKSVKCLNEKRFWAKLGVFAALLVVTTLLFHGCGKDEGDSPAVGAGTVYGTTS